MDTSILQSIGSTWSTDRVSEFISACYDRRMLMTVVLNHASNWMLGRLICEVSETHIQPRLARGWVSLGSEEETARELVARALELIPRLDELRPRRTLGGGEALDLSWCRGVSDDGVGLLVDACPELRTLTIWGCSQLTQRFFGQHSNPKLHIIGRGPSQ